MMEFNTPIKKKDIFIVTPVENININLIDIKIIDINIVTTNKIELLVYIPNENTGLILDNLEKETIKTIKEKNKIWFKNGLSEENIVEFYNPTFNSQNNILKIFIYKSNYPTILYNNKEYDDIFEIFNKKKLNDIMITIDTTFIGIYIQPTTYYNNIIINKIVFISDDSDESSDKETILNSWERELYKTEKKIEDRIEELKNIKSKIILKYNLAKENKLWKNELEKLRSYLNNIFIRDI
jgi:hypothetical protein